jgi:hypothetical protein
VPACHRDAVEHRKGRADVALVSRMVSDITGTEAPGKDFVTLVVRAHPVTEEPKALDVLPAEVDLLRSAADVVVLESKGDGQVRRFFVTLTEFRRYVDDDVVARARGTRGRRPGVGSLKR